MRLRTLLLILALLLGHGLVPSNEIVAAQTDGAALRLAMPPLDTLDPLALAPADLDGRDLAENVLVGLFRYDAATRSAVPLLARTWTVSDDGLTWTFTLRDDVQWVRYDSEAGQGVALGPVVAGDFVAALRRACHPDASPAIGTRTLATIEGCYTAAHIDPLLVTDEIVADLVGAAAPDAATLVLRLAFPAAYLPALLTQPEFRPIPPQAAFSADWSWTVHNGPYVIAARQDDGLTLVRNPFWPDAAPGSVARVEVTFLPDPTARADAFTRGQADFVHLGAAQGAALQAQTPERVQVRRGMTVLLLGFSTERRFVREVGVRQALSWALDREALRAALNDPRYLPVTTLTPPGVVAGPPEEAGVGYAPEAARAALAAAGFPACASVPEPIQVMVTEDLLPLGQAIVAGWTETLGCAPDLFAVLPGSPAALDAYSRRLIEADAERPHLWLMTWTLDYLDAQSGAADAFHCASFFSGLDCAPLDALIDLAAAFAPAEARPDLYARIEARYFGPGGLYPAVPLLAEAQYVGVAATLRGVEDFGPAWWGGWEL